MYINGYVEYMTIEILLIFSFSIYVCIQKQQKYSGREKETPISLYSRIIPNGCFLIEVSKNNLTM